MKSKLLLLVLSCCVVLFGCKKEKSPEAKLADVKKQIIATWQVESATEAFYDANGKVVKTSTATEYNDAQIRFVNDNTYTTPDYPDTGSFAYTLTTVNGKVTLQIDDTAYEVVTISSNNMTWTTELGISSNSGVVKSIITIRFKKI